MKRFYFLLCLTLLELSAYSQATQLPQTSDLSVIPPAPEAASLIRFVEYPVSYCTGVPEISVPLYTVKSREISFLVSLNYHASGIKMNDVSGTVGLGWSLNAGGVISRVIHGLPDSGFRGVEMRDAKEVHDSNDYRYLKQVMCRNKEANLDRYYYNFCGVSGSFVITPDSSIIQIPLTDNKIERVPRLSAPSFPPEEDFKITTPDGTCYYFRETEYINGTDYTAVSSWYLTKIVSFNRTDSVEFVYSMVGQWIDEIPTTIQTGFLMYDLKWIHKMSFETALSSNRVSYGNCRLLNEIRFNDNRMTFTYASDRKDTGLGERLNDIKVYGNETEVFHAKLQNSGPNFGDGRLKLGGVDFLDVKGRLTDQYTFNYVNEGWNMRENIYSQDMFGYYNGKHNYSLSYLSPNGQENGARDYSISYATCYTLQEIGRLTGGYTRFGYEASSCEREGRKTLNIGIRVAYITDYENSSHPVKNRKFTYENSTPSFSLPNDFNWSYYTIQTGVRKDVAINDMLQTQIYNYYYPYSVVPGQPVEEVKIYYGKVTETITGSGGDDTIRTEYQYDTREFRNKTGDATYAPLIEDGNIYTNRYVGNNAPDIRFSSLLLYDYILECNWANNNLLKKITYQTKNGSWIPVESITNTYQKYNLQQVQIGLFVRGVVYTYSPTTELYDMPCNRVQDFSYFNVYVETGCSRLKSTTTELQTEDGKLTDRIDYTYNSLDYPVRTGDNQLVRTQTYTQGGRTYKRTYFYPVDCNTLPCVQMYAAHNISALVKEELEINGTSKVSVNNTFQILNRGTDAQIVLQNTERMFGNTLSDRFIYHNYDRSGHPVYVSQNDGPKICYIWGYNGAYPVAEIRNTEYNAVIRALGGENVLEAIHTGRTLSEDGITRLNALRTSLPEAEVTTYTYKPLVGILTITDPAGRKISYEYDAAGRLYRVLDEEGNPLNKYEYVFKGQ